MMFRSIINRANKRFLTAIQKHDYSTNVKDLVISRTIGESSAGTKFAIFASTFVFTHWTLALGTSYYLLNVPEIVDEGSERYTRDIVVENVKNQLLFALTKEDRIRLEEDEEAMNQELKRLEIPIEQLVQERLSERENAKKIGSGIMIGTAVVSSCACMFFARKFVSRIVMKCPAVNTQKAISMDLYTSTMNPFVSERYHSIDRFTRLTILQAKSKRPQVVFTPLFPDGKKRIVYYFAKSPEDAQQVHDQLENSGLYDENMTGAFNSTAPSQLPQKKNNNKIETAA
jgi:hypothetical protein